MVTLGVLTFLTVAFLFMRRRYLRSPLGSYAPESVRERMVNAAELLVKRGYRIVSERVAHDTHTYFGSQRFTGSAHVDFLVEREAILFPARVRRSRDPERITGPWLRAQFLPLFVMYDAPVLYVDADAQKVIQIDFAVDWPTRYYRRRWSSRLLWLIVGVAVGWLLSLAK
ncbi:MAG: hypothetical protein OWT27_00960 [Firmicutes bacterium]|nr:hypothetical protein [Bacillota bacterium]